MHIKQVFSAILAQSENISNTKPTAVVSRSTRKVEQYYAQLALEAMAVAFACIYSKWVDTPKCHCHRQFIPFTPLKDFREVYLLHLKFRDVHLLHLK